MGVFLPVAASYQRRRSGEMTSIIGPPSALTIQELANSRKEYNFSVIISFHFREEIIRIAGVFILFISSPEHQLAHRVAVFASCRPGFPRSVCCQVPGANAIFFSHQPHRYHRYAPANPNPDACVGCKSCPSSTKQTPRQATSSRPAGTAHLRFFCKLHHFSLVNSASHPPSELHG